MKRYVKYCEEAEDLHNSIVEMPIPQDEFDKQTKWFDAKLAENQCFQKEITEWLSDAGRTLRADKTCDASSAVNSEIGPDDSISNVSTKQSQCSKVSKGSASTSSSTSSARIKAMAERAALVQHAAAMEKKHTLEEEEERLRIQSERLKRQKEQLMMNAKIAANDARLSVLNPSAVGSSKKASSDDSKRKKSHSLNPDSQVNLPGNPTQVAMHYTTTQQSAGIQDGTAVVQNNPVSRSQLQIHSLQSPVHPPTDEVQGILYNIMQQQANITAQLVHRGDVASLPPRVIPIFDGDPLQFAAFIQAFEHGIERKTTNAQDCLYYLEQYTRGQPRELVRSCHHMSAEQGFRKAKNLLKEHFGHEFKITAAYMEKALNWPAIKPDDINGLQAYALFLRGYCNVMVNLQYMDEINVSSNLKNIMMKLPYTDSGRNGERLLVNYKNEMVVGSSL